LWFLTPYEQRRGRDLIIMKSKSVFDLDERLINFASSILELSDRLPQTLAGRHMAGKLIRSGTAPALHYGEAQAAESRKDFIHKMKVALKELRETFNGLKIEDRKVATGR